MHLRAPITTCKGCGRQLRERKRKPCPNCQSINRVIAVTANDYLTAADKAN